MKNINKEIINDNEFDLICEYIKLRNESNISQSKLARRVGIAKSEHPKGLKENIIVAKRGGKVAKETRNLYEKETKKSAISNKNSLNYKYISKKEEIGSK